MQGRPLGRIDDDLGVRRLTLGGLKEMRELDTCVTSGTQTHASDGRATLLITTEEKARELSRDPAIDIRFVAKLAVRNASQRRARRPRRSAARCSRAPHPRCSGSGNRQERDRGLHRCRLSLDAERRFGGPSASLSGVHDVGHLPGGARRHGVHADNDGVRGAGGAAGEAGMTEHRRSSGSTSYGACCLAFSSGSYVLSLSVDGASSSKEPGSR